MFSVGLLWFQPVQFAQMYYIGYFVVFYVINFFSFLNREDLWQIINISPKEASQFYNSGKTHWYKQFQSNIKQHDAINEMPHPFISSNIAVTSHIFSLQVC